MSLIALLFLTGGAVYFLQHPNNPLDDLQTLQQYAPDTSALFSKDTSKQIYRWQDPQGNWHYTDQPPENNTKMEQSSDHFQREMQTIRASEKVVKQTKNSTLSAQADQPAESSTDLLIPGLPTPGTVMKIIDNVRNLEGKIQERDKKTQESINSSNN